MTEEPLIAHLVALRRSVIRSAIAIAIACIPTLLMAKQLYEWLALPLVRHLPKGSYFIATTPMEAWVVYVKVGLVAGLFLASPIVFAQLWAFIAPGLYAHEKRLGVIFVIVSSVCFLGGAAFAYFIALPVGFAYFVSILYGTNIQFLPSMSSYLGFALQILLAFGLVFELPIFIFCLSILNIVSHDRLTAFRKYFVVLAFIVAAILTPPDVVSQICLALPILALYEVGLWTAWGYRRVSGSYGSTT